MSTPHDSPAPRAGSSDLSYLDPAPQHGWADAPTAAAGPPPHPYDPRTAVRSPGLGIVALAATVIGALVGSTLAVIGGAALGRVDPTVLVSSGLPDSAEQQDLMVGGVFFVLAYLSAGVFGLWGFVQGIVATTLDRGRGWGIAAIVLAVLAWMPVTIAFVVSIQDGQAAQLATG